jgi:hypothetical protein
LLLKLGVFAAMLALAATNRFWLTPRLSLAGEGALRWLARNSAVEFVLALAILAIVGMLGTLHPAIHLTASSTFPERQIPETPPRLWTPQVAILALDG